MKFGKILPFALGFLPLVALAQDAPDFSYFRSGLNEILMIINTYLIPGVIAIGLLWFLWGVFSYIKAGSEEEKVKGRSMMINGIIALFVMVAVWGLVNLVSNITGVNPVSEPPTIPGLQ